MIGDRIKLRRGARGRDVIQEDQLIQRSDGLKGVVYFPELMFFIRGS